MVVAANPTAEKHASEDGYSINTVYYVNILWLYGFLYNNNEGSQ